MKPPDQSCQDLKSARNGFVIARPRPAAGPFGRSAPAILGASRLNGGLPAEWGIPDATLTCGAACLNGSRMLPVPRQSALCTAAAYRLSRRQGGGHRPIAASHARRKNLVMPPALSPFHPPRDRQSALA